MEVYWKTFAASKLEIKTKGSFRHVNSCNWNHQIPKPLYQVKIAKAITILPVKLRKNTTLNS